MKYAVEYRHKGKAYAVDIYADSLEDARAHMASIYHNGEPQEVLMRMSIPDFLGKGRNA